MRLITRFAQDLAPDTSFVPGLGGAVTENAEGRPPAPMPMPMPASDASAAPEGREGLPKREEKTIAKNRRVFHDYEILETYEAGIELTGTEVRSLRRTTASSPIASPSFRNGEVWLNNVHISPYSMAASSTPTPTGAGSSCCTRSRFATWTRRWPRRAWPSCP